MDVIVLMDDELIPSSYIKCKLIGVLETKDDAGIDPKLIMCPSTKVDPTYSVINNISDISPITKNKIHYFFTHYKDLENKSVEIGEFKDKLEAIKVHKESVERYNSRTNNKCQNVNKITSYYQRQRL